MRKFTLCLLAVFLSFTVCNSVLADGAKNSVKTSQAKTEITPEDDHGNFYRIGRGFTNFGTCWLEVFRCMAYRNTQVPFWGFIAGAVEGSGLTGIRAFTGVPDILFLGYMPEPLFNDRFRDFIWNSPWQPPKKKDKK